MNKSKLIENEIESRLPDIPLWTRTPDGKLTRHFHFVSFIEAFGFLTQVAIVSEARNHHPEISNVYNKVSLQLITHDADGLTSSDFDLAARIDQIASRMGY